jgi:hypothetical protein
MLRGAGLVFATTLMHGYGPPEARAQSPGGPSTLGPFVPVPEWARPPQIPPKGYLLDQLGDGLYGIRDGIDQSLFLVSRRGVAAIDAPAAFGEKVLAAIAEVTSQPVTHVIYSHSHVDHIGAAHLFPPTATFIAHERTALNDLAVVAPDWLRQQVTAEWFERYGKRIEETRFPKGEAKRYAYAEQIGADGLELLGAIYHETAPAWLHAIPTVEHLRQTWGHPFYTDATGLLRWREAKDLPPAGMRMDSPYAPEAHFGNKRSITWTGYKVHLTETCDEDALHVMTHVETTEAAVTEVTTPSFNVRLYKSIGMAEVGPPVTSPS